MAGSNLREVIIIDKVSGDAAAVNAKGQFHVVLMSEVDTNNSTVTPLGIGGSFVGTATETLDFGTISINIFSDVASAASGLVFEQSSNGTNWDVTDEFSYLAGTGKTYTVQTAAQYFRVNFTNGGVGQASFRLQTILKKTASIQSSHRIGDNLSPEDDGQLVISIIKGQNPGGDYVDFSATAGGNFKVSLEELESGISSNTNSQLNVTQFEAGGNEGTYIIDGVDPTIKAGVIANADDDTDLDGLNGVVADSVLYARIDADTVKPARMDASTHSLQAISYPHHEVHAGDSYGCIDVEDLALNNVLDIQMTTPNTTKWIHMTISYDTESETVFEMYENVAINVAGAATTPVNHNRNSGNSAGLGIGIITNTSTANANADTAIAGADLLAASISGAGRSGGSDEHSHEWILKQNEDYTLRFTATAAGYTDYHLSWYEHTEKD